jgi:hypothetical protein
MILNSLILKENLSSFFSNIEIILNFAQTFKTKKMKKVLLIAAVGVISLASCKKDYTCVCKDSAGTTWGTYTVHETKKKSKEACEANNASWSAYGASCAIQ